MSEPPKLYTNKPKRAQLKQQSPQPPSPSPSPSSSMASTQPTTPSPSPSPSPPPQPPKESFARRYKFIWPLLLTVNIAVGAYVLTRTKKKDGEVEVSEVAKESSTPVSATTVTASSVTEITPSPPSLVTKLNEPIPEDQQRQLFKWMLEEKRKIKPKDKEEKIRIDEEKALIKQFLRAKSIPTL